MHAHKFANNPKTVRHHHITPDAFLIRIRSSIESQSKVEVMELSDLHHPNCKINRNLNTDMGVGVATDPCRRESESSDSILLSPEASKATEAVEFIAEHLRNEDLYIQVRRAKRQRSEI